MPSNTMSWVCLIKQISNSQQCCLKRRQQVSYTCHFFSQALTKIVMFVSCILFYFIFHSSLLFFFSFIQSLCVCSFSICKWLFVSPCSTGFNLIIEPFDDRTPTIPNPILHFRWRKHLVVMLCINLEYAMFTISSEFACPGYPKSTIKKKPTHFCVPH